MMVGDGERAASSIVVADRCLKAYLQELEIQNHLMLSGLCNSYSHIGVDHMYGILMSVIKQEVLAETLTKVPHRLRLRTWAGEIIASAEHISGASEDIKDERSTLVSIRHDCKQVFITPLLRSAYTRRMFDR